MNFLNCFCIFTYLFLQFRWRQSNWYNRYYWLKWLKIDEIRNVYYCDILSKKTASSASIVLYTTMVQMYKTSMISIELLIFRILLCY